MIERKNILDKPLDRIDCLGDERGLDRGTEGDCLGDERGLD